MLLILFVVCLNAAINHLDAVRIALGRFFGLLSPILIGFILAFLLSIPVNALERHIIKPHGKRALRLQQTLQRPASIILSILLIVGVIAFIIYTVIPNLFSSIHIIFTDMPLLLEHLKDLVRPYREQIPDIVAWIEGLSIDWSSIESKIAAFFSNDSAYASQMLNEVVSAASSVFGQMLNRVLALIIAFSAVSQKERLSEQAKNMLHAFLHPEHADNTISYVRKIGRVFSDFIHLRASIGSLYIGRYGDGRYADSAPSIRSRGQFTGYAHCLYSHRWRLGIGDCRCSDDSCSRRCR